MPERGYTRKQIESLLKFIDWIITLPEGLENQLADEIEKIEEEHKMTYVTSWERIAEKKGRLEGKKEGIIKGKKEEKLEIAKELIKNGVSIDIICKATGFSREEIEGLVTTVQ